MERVDVAVLGSGPAGLEAALNLTIRKKKILLFGSADLSGKIAAAPRIDNYLGLPGISGSELQTRFRQHLDSMGISILSEQIQLVYPMGSFFSLASAKETYEATAVILATGAFSSKLLEGEEKYLGRGVGYCATCDAPLYRGKTVAVLGYTDESVLEANYIGEIAATTYFIPMGKLTRKPVDAVQVLHSKALGVAGDTAVRTLLLEDQSLPVDGVFVLRESVAPASLVPGMIINDRGFIQVDTDMATSIPGCFAAGDCTGKPHQYMRAAGQGQTAGLNAAAYIDKLQYEGK